MKKLLILATTVTTAIILGSIYMQNKKEPINEINIALIGAIPQSVDPADMKTVAHQYLLQYLIGNQAFDNEKVGFEPLFSQFDLNEDLKTLTITLKEDTRDNNGDEFTVVDLKNALNKTFREAIHSPYSKLIKSTDIKDGKVILSFEKIPYGLISRFTLEEYGLIRETESPITLKKDATLTGPYNISHVDETGISFSVNDFYPKEFRSNTLPVNIKTIKSHDEINLSTHQLAYIPGFLIGTSGIETLESKGFEVTYFPDEYSMFLGLKPNVPIEKRNYLQHIILDFKKEYFAKTKLSRPSYSLAPSGRVNSADNTRKNLSAFETEPFPKYMNLGVHPFLKNVPTVKPLLKYLETKGIVIEYSKDKSQHNVSLFVLGQNPSSPLNAYAYLARAHPEYFGEILNEDEIQSMSILPPNTVLEKAKEVENILVEKKQIIIPISYFGSVVVNDPRLKRDYNLSWNWGVQAWTYKLKQ